MDNKRLIDELRRFVTDERYALLDEKLRNRTRYVTVVLENVFHDQNTSAVLRTCECLGLQDVYVIQNSNEFAVHPTISSGAGKWLTIHSFDETDFNTPQCIDELKSRGYRIVATTPHDSSRIPPVPGHGASFVVPERSDSLYSFDITEGPVAVVIGSERNGISQYVVDNADDFITVPMYGFTESFNLSACASIISSYLRHEMEIKNIVSFLSDEEYNELMVRWLLASIRNSDMILSRILSE